MFYDELKLEVPSLIRKQLFEWCQETNTMKDLIFGVVIPDYNIIIELDGEEHFKQVQNCESPERIRQQDLYKMFCANKNGYSTMRILQDDVWHDRYDWFTVILKQIEKIKNCDEILNIFLHLNSEYNIFLKEIEAIGGTETNVVNRFIKVH
jgi:very-short-patch-repair endonuclease